MNVRFIKSNEKKEILNELKERFGIGELNYLLLETGKEKIRGFSGTMNKDELLKLGEIARVELIGTYLLKKENSLRISLDGTHILKKDIKKNVLDLSFEQFFAWMNGGDLDIKVDRGVVVIKYKDDLLGCGISNGEKIFNYLPKERRLTRR